MEIKKINQKLHELHENKLATTFFQCLDGFFTPEHFYFKSPDVYKFIINEDVEGDIEVSEVYGVETGFKETYFRINSFLYLELLNDFKLKKSQEPIN